MTSTLFQNRLVSKEKKRSKKDNLGLTIEGKHGDMCNDPCV